MKPIDKLAEEYSNDVEAAFFGNSAQIEKAYVAGFRAARSMAVDIQDRGYIVTDKMGEEEV